MFRPTKFAKYLPEFDWSAHILTRYQKQYDSNTNEYENIMQKCSSVNYCAELLPVPDLNDDGLRWATKLLPSLVRQIESNDIDVVYYTGKPFIPFTLAPLVKMYTGVPYVLDLRDPWSISAYWSETILSRSYRLFSSAGEWYAFRGADAIVCATETMTEQYSQEYPQFSAKFYTIPNGFDPDDYAGYSPASNDAFTITYIGKFASFRDSEPFLEAVQELVADGCYVQFCHIGHEEEHVREEVRDRNLTDYFNCTGYLPREEAIPIVSGSDVGLVITNRKEALTTKVFDYIACNIPILGVGPEGGEMRRLVDRFENGYTCDEHTVGQTLRKIYAAQPGRLDKESERNRYTRKRMTEELAGIFDSVT